MAQRDFAERLGKAMRAAGLSQAKLAEKVGVSQPAVSAWLRGAEIKHRHYRRLVSVLPMVGA